MQSTIRRLGVADVDRLRALWLQLHAHHRAVSSLPLVADDEVSWTRRRAQYRRLLREDRGAVLAAERDGAVVGYATVVFHVGDDDTFTWGPRRAELYTLVVDARTRGAGVGTALLAAVDGELDARGVDYLTVAVIAGNEGALDFYVRRGLRPAEVVLHRVRSSPTHL